MSKVVDDFINLTEGRNPRFVLKRSVGGAIRLKHSKEPPATRSALEKLEATLNGISPELLEIYQRLNGGRFFANAKDPEQCFFILPLKEMKPAKRELENWLFMHQDEADDYSEEKDEDGRLRLAGPPPWWKSAIVFAGFGYASERLFISPEGRHAGKVFIYDHESGGVYALLRFLLRHSEIRSRCRLTTIH